LFLQPQRGLPTDYHPEGAAESDNNTRLNLASFRFSAMQRDAPESLSILKPLFGLDKNGRYGIHHLAVVPLAARAQDASDFFQIQDDLLLVQPNYVSTILATLGQSIVPVVATVRGEGLIRCLGTGFFVSASGLFITAAHVIIDPIERNYGGAREIEEMTWAFDGLEVGVLTSTNPVFEPKGWIFRPIEWASFLAQRSEQPLPIPTTSLKLTTDIAICKVRQSTTTSFYQPLSDHPTRDTRIGASAWKTRDRNRLRRNARCRF
jgi:hypothetical protein